MTMKEKILLAMGEGTRVFPVVMLFIVSLRKESEIHFTELYKSIQTTFLSSFHSHGKKKSISRVLFYLDTLYLI